MNSLPRTIAFSLVMIIYLAFPFWMIYQHEDILKVGESFRFLPRAYDPYDAFRGRYVTLNYDNLRVNYPNAEEEFIGGQEVYVKVLKDANGYAYFAEVSASPFEGSNYVKTKASYIRGDYIQLRAPENMQRYYMNEDKAPVAETAYRDLTRGRRGEARDSTQLYLDVKIHEGQVVIEDLYMNGIKAKDYIDQLIEEETNRPKLNVQD